MRAEAAQAQLRAGSGSWRPTKPMTIMNESSSERRNVVLERTRLEYGDITAYCTDGIVNAANETLLGGGGVDGAIHRAAGPELLAACRKLDGCKVGEAKVTPGFCLPSRYVIHTVGPVWSGGQAGEAGLLEKCYWNSLVQAVNLEMKTVAFPAISCGVFGFPVDLAAKIATQAVVSFLGQHDSIEMVHFACHGDEVYEALEQARS